MDVKYCSKCETTLPVSEFNRKGNGYQAPCRKCWSTQNKERYKANKRYYVDKARVAKDKLRRLVRDFKNRPCTDCNVLYPQYVMDLDHLRDKSFTISTEWWKRGIHVLRRELEKCEVVCSNCHRERTQQRLCADSLMDKI